MKAVKALLPGSLLCWILISCGAQAAERPDIRGEWQQGGILMGKVAPGSQVKVDDRPARVSPEGRVVFGLNRDAPASVTLTITGPDGERQVYNYAVQSREYDIQRITGVAQEHVTPPEAVQARIAREAQLVRKARTLDDTRTDFWEPFIWPLVGPITGVYGSQRIFNGVPRAPHYGLDIAAPTGTKVIAPASGLVTLAEPDLYFSGGTLILDHGHGLSSTFIHLHKLLVEVGDEIEQGQVIAEVGATGRATGPHLDWRMNWFDVRLDPQLLMIDIPMEPAEAHQSSSFTE